MATFDITRPKDAITLDEAGSGLVAFTVTNLAARTMKVRLEVVVDRPLDAALLKIEGGADRNFRPNDSQNIQVSIAATAQTEPGVRKFSLKAVDVELPDEHFGESQTVSFAVPERKQEPKFKLWWLVPVAAVLILVAAGGAWYVYNNPKIEDYRGRNSAEAISALKELGMTVKTVKNTIVLDAKTSQTVVGQKIGTEPAEDGMRVKRGTEITLDVAVRMPRVRGLKIDDARKELADVGIETSMVEVKSVAKLEPANEWDTVVAQLPDPLQPNVTSDHVVLTVVVKPEDVSVPQVIGLDPCAAQNKLSASGLVGRLIHNGNPIGPGIVLAPPPGQILPKGSTVVIVYQGQRTSCWNQFAHIVSAGGLSTIIRESVLRKK